MTPQWQAAIDAGDVERLRALLDAGAEVDALDSYGQTGLMRAAVRGRADVVRLLVSQGAMLDHTAKHRLSALMLAVLYGHVEIVRLLVQAGADTTLRGGGAPGFYEKTAVDLAREQGRDDLIEALGAVTLSDDRSPGGA